MEIIDILREIGYSPSSEGNCYRMKAVYRGGNNRTSLVVFKKDGGYFDYVTGEKGSLQDLVARTLNCSLDESVKFCNRGATTSTKFKSQKEETEQAEKFSERELDSFLPIYKFYNDRGISNETLKFFKSGYCPVGKMSDRYTFPMYNNTGAIVGLSGRDVLGYRDAKWKKIGKSKSWDYPYYFLKDFIHQEDHIIIVESIGDMLNLFESGVKNVLCLCGKELSQEMLKTILKINPKRIILSLNKDEEKKDGSRPGQDAANKIKNSLTKFFNVNSIEIKLPTRKDFGEMSKTEILEWKQTI